MIRLQQVIIVLGLAAALFASSCSSSAEQAAPEPVEPAGVDWRAEFIALSESPHAAALYYPEPLDESTVEDVAGSQCNEIDEVLNRFGPDGTTPFEVVTDHLAQLRNAEVPESIIERDLAALDAAMSEGCPSTRRRWAEYLAVDAFVELAGCERVFGAVSLDEHRAGCA